LRINFQPLVKRIVYVGDKFKKNIEKDSKNKRICKECKKLASFGFGKIIEFCFDHRKEGMTNIRIKKCIYEGCIKFPSFGYLGESSKFCFKHKEHDMINLAHKTCK